MNMNVNQKLSMSLDDIMKVQQQDNRKYYSNILKKHV